MSIAFSCQAGHIDLISRLQVWASPYHVAHALAVVERIMDTVPALRAAPDAPQAAAVAAEVCVIHFCILCMSSCSLMFRLACFSTLLDACHCSSLTKCAQQKSALCLIMQLKHGCAPVLGSAFLFQPVCLRSAWSE